MGTGNGCDLFGTVQIADSYCNLFNKPADGAFSTTTALADPKQNDNIIGTFYVSPDQATTIDLLELRVILVPTDIVSIVTFCPKQTTGTGVSINFEVE